MAVLTKRTVALIIAHPDDETLWAGGTILSHPTWNWFIVCVCGGSDPDRAPRFYNALNVFKSDGVMGDLDDRPELNPLDKKEVKRVIMELLPVRHFDLVISHNPVGEYTKHIRHEEVGKAVINLWCSGKISTHELWTFAYEDGNKEYYPRAIQNASICRTLTRRIWLRKYSIITETYGFEKNSFESETTPRAEAFWQFTDPDHARKWIKQSVRRPY